MKKINRRTFLKNTTALAVGAVALPNILAQATNKPIGIQLWSVREAMSKDAKGTLTALSKYGYKYVEGFGFREGKWFGMTPKELKKALADLGMTMPTGHQSVVIKNYDNATKSFDDNFKKAVDAAVEVGQKYLICPFLPDSERGADTIMRLCEVFNRAGEYCKTKGLRFGYHNHSFEFEKFPDGQIMYDVLIQNTDPKLVTMEMDMCWVAAAGYNPVDWIKRYPGRYELAHIKDIKTWGKAGSAIVGHGQMDWKQVLSYQKMAGLKMLIVELENYEKTPVEDVGVCIQNLKKLIS